MKRFGVYLAACVFGLALAGCTRAGNTPDDYFPLSAGTTWEYRITVGPTEPMMFTTTWSPVGQTTYAVRDNRSRYRAYMKDPTKRTYALAFRVKGSGTLPSALKNMSGLEIQIIKDELGVFGERPIKVCWAVDRAEGLRVTEVIEMSGMSTGYPTNDHSRKLLFFEGEAGTGMTVGSESEYLYYTGSEKGKLHYQRKIESTTPGFEVPSHIQDMDRLTCAIDQDVWFESGKGLTKLVQTQNGQTALTWELVRFTAGR